MQKNNLNILVTAYSISTFSQGILGPIYVFFVQKIGGGILEASCAFAIFSIVTGVTTLLIYRTKLSHTYQKEFLCFGWFLWLISVIMYFFVRDIYMLFFVEIISALGAAISNPAYHAEFSKQTLDDLLSGWALQDGVSTIFYGLACLTGGLIEAYFGFSVLMLTMIFLSTISFLLIFYYTYRAKFIKE